MPSSAPNLAPEEGLGRRWGDPNVEAFKVLVNAGIPFANGMELYGHADYMDNTTVSDFFYRDGRAGPPNAPQAAGITARTTLMIDNVNNTTGVGPPDGLPDPASAVLVNSITAQGLNPADYLTAGTAPSGFVLLNPIHTLFPGGYNPDFGADITDFAVAVGLRGDISETLTWDVHGRYGEDKVDYDLSVSINPSLRQPLADVVQARQAHTGRERAQSRLRQDFRELAAQPRVRCRVPQRDLPRSDRATTPPWSRDPPRRSSESAPDGFQGFPAESSGSFESDSYAAYVDAETDPDRSAVWRCSVPIRGLR